MTFPRLHPNTPAQGGPDSNSGQPERIGLAMIVIMAGVLMTAVDTTIVVLALPEIERSLHVPLTDVVWVIISFLLVITLLATQVGRTRPNMSPSLCQADPLLPPVLGAGTALRGGVALQPGESHLLSLTNGSFFASRD